MSDLIVNNTLEVTTDYGLRQIQLCVGSVTKSKDPVDVLVVSAFPGIVIFSFLIMIKRDSTYEVK